MRVVAVAGPYRLCFQPMPQIFRPCENWWIERCVYLQHTGDEHHWIPVRGNSATEDFLNELCKEAEKEGGDGKS